VSANVTMGNSLDLLRVSVTDFLRRRALPSPSAARGAVPEFDQAVWSELADLGWLGVGLPEALGGYGLGVDEIAVICEPLGRGASAIPYIAASVLPNTLLAGCEPGAGVEELASVLVTGQRSVSVAWQERSHQLDGTNFTTTLGSGRLTGIKRFVAGAESNGMLLVSVSSPAGAAVVAVDSAAPGVSVQRYAAGLGSEATVHFDQSPVSFGGPLATGDTATRALARALRMGRVALSAQLAGLASGSLDRTLEYIGCRVQFGRPISSFQSIRHRCVDLSIGTRLAQATCSHAVRRFASGPDSAGTAAAISAAKARCGDVAVQVGRESIQMHGAMGCTEEAGVGVFFRAAVHGRAWLGGPLAHRRRFMEYQRQNRESVDG
jgi:alkylation response protein AidB-like acyl-CoA dehydrogenase